MRFSMACVRAMCAAAGLMLSSLALGQVGSVQTAQPSGVSIGSPTASCGSSTYLASFATASALTLSSASGATTGAFLINDEEVVASNLPAAINDASGTVTWSVARGTLLTPDSSPIVAGLVISNVRLVDAAGIVTAFSAASIITDDTAWSVIEAIRSTSGVEVVPSAEANAARSLGSSCSCPACPLGGRFWAPFFVIGVRNTSSVAEACCGLACAAGCNSLHTGAGYPEAWLVGQGVWVTCMLCA